mgnify:CR=1 FL=1
MNGLPRLADMSGKIEALVISGPAAGERFMDFIVRSLRALDHQSVTFISLGATRLLVVSFVFN